MNRLVLVAMRRNLEQATLSGNAALAERIRARLARLDPPAPREEPIRPPRKRAPVAEVLVEPEPPAPEVVAEVVAEPMQDEQDENGTR